MILGEALALRALLHFDLLRMFAPSMEADDGKAYIPYVDAYPVISTTYYANSEILEKIETDLIEARKLLAICDVEQHPEWLRASPRMLGKVLRMNYRRMSFMLFVVIVLTTMLSQDCWHVCICGKKIIRLLLIKQKKW